MAFSNREVALRLFTHTNHDADGSHFRVERCSDQPYIAGFRLHSFVYSYSTVIAQLMQREDNPDAMELWTTANRFSQTTDRHMFWITNALYVHNSHAHTSSPSPTSSASSMKPLLAMRTAAPVKGCVPSYTTQSGNRDSLQHRCNPIALSAARYVAHNNLLLADAPRLRAPTREAHLHAARRALGRALFNATDCIPAEHPAHKTWPDLQDQIDQTLDTLHTVDQLILLASEGDSGVTAMRTTVRALAALNNPAHA